MDRLGRSRAGTSTLTVHLRVRQLPSLTLLPARLAAVLICLSVQIPIDRYGFQPLAFLSLSGHQPTTLFSYLREDTMQQEFQKLRYKQLAQAHKLASLDSTTF